MLSHQTLKVIADSVNPTLGILAIVLPFTKWRDVWRLAAAHLGVTLLIVALTYLFRAILQLEALWANWGLDYSTHEAICIDLVVASSSLYWRRAWIWCTVLLAYDALMVYQSYHTWPDLETTAAVMLPFAVTIRYGGDRVAGLAIRRGTVTS